MTRRHVTAGELARRTRANHTVRISPDLAATFLAYWLERGIVEEPAPGRYRLTARGAAMFSGWAAEVELDDEAAA